MPLNHRRLEGSNERASGLEHAFDTGVHFLFLDELAALCCSNSFFDGFKEPGFVVQVTDKNILHQTLRIGPNLSGHLRKLRFLLRTEMYFHRLQGTEKPRVWQVIRGVLFETPGQ